MQPLSPDQLTPAVAPLVELLQSNEHFTVLTLMSVAAIIGITVSEPASAQTLAHAHQAARRMNAADPEAFALALVTFNTVMLNLREARS